MVTTQKKKPSLSLFNNKGKQITEKQIENYLRKMLEKYYKNLLDSSFISKEMFGNIDKKINACEDILVQVITI